jgi:hypothetical protein
MPSPDSSGNPFFEGFACSVSERQIIEKRLQRIAGKLLLIKQYKITDKSFFIKIDLVLIVRKK